MIKLKLNFDKDGSQNQDIEIIEGELLSIAVKRSVEQIPLGDFKIEQIFNAVLNGQHIEYPLWEKIQLRQEDVLVITPKIRDGDFGQIFKQVVIIAAAITASVLTGGLGAVASAAIVAGVTIATTLALNALIPPISPNAGTNSSSSSIDQSQMYAITGQSNKMTPLGFVPKVYGTFRMFPIIAATPYTELSVDPSTGEIVQYLVCIYDFGLGTPQISKLQIGDTPLTLSSFTDFQYNLVDPNQPDVPQDNFDLHLEKGFKIYKGSRHTGALSIALIDGQESIQLTDDNPAGDTPEITLDFVCPSGLYGYDAGGQKVAREVNLDIEFAPVGSSDWKAYNDTSAVSHFEFIGGTDTVVFSDTFPALQPDHPLFDLYFDGYGYSNGSYANIVGGNFTSWVYPKQYSNSILANSSDGWQVGRSVFVSGEFKGNILSITPVIGYPTYVQLNLDQTNIGYALAYYWYGQVAYNDPTITWISAQPIAKITSSDSIPGRANIVGDKTTPVYASFRFTPKVPQQYQVRVRRIGSTGNYALQKGDDVTWGGITTAYARKPIKTTKRHVFMELRIKATSQLNGNIQNLSAVCSQVLPVYDPNTQTWSRQVTSNPAWVFCDILTGEVNKKAVDVPRLHLDSILEWADYCAEVPTPPPGATYIYPRFQANFILDYNTTCQDLLIQLGSAAQASLNIIDGKYGVLIDRTKNTPVQVFTPRNSKNFSSSRLYAARPDGVKVQWIDPNTGWTNAEVAVYDNGFNEQNAEKFDNLTAFGCISHEQAWRFGRYMIAQSRLRQETMTLLVDFEHLICTRGDFVQISQDVMEVGGRPARVKSVSGIQFTIDDDIDIDPLLNYGVTHRAIDGVISDSDISVLSSNTFSLISNKLIFSGDTRAYALDVYYRFGGIPLPIGRQRRVDNLAASTPWNGAVTTYTLPYLPISDDDLCIWLDGEMRTDWSRSGLTVTFPFDSGTQQFDAILRESSSDVTGTLKKLYSVTGNYDGTNTNYVIPDAPISIDDTLVFQNGNYRSNISVAGNVISVLGYDSTTEDIDIQYRYNGGASRIGTGKRELAVSGAYNPTSNTTTYTLLNEPISDNDMLAFFDGFLRSDYNQGLAPPAVGDLVVIGEVSQIVFDCIVKSIAPNDDQSATLTLLERANEIFDYESTNVLPDYNPQLSNTSIPDAAPPLAVRNLTLIDNTWQCAQTKSGYNYYADISWDIPPGSVYEFFEIWFDDGRGYAPVAQTMAKRFHVDIDQTRLGSNMGLKVVAVAASGKKLQLIQMPEVRFTPIAKNTPPSDVIDLGMNITNQTLQLSWDLISDCDCAGYEIRFSSGTNDVWEASIPLQTVDRNTSSLTVQARTGAYLIKAVDFAGNKSTNAARGITTIPNLFDINVIQEFNDAPTFTGMKQQTAMLGEAVILDTLRAGTVDTMMFQPEGFYEIAELLDLGDIYTVRLSSYIRADGYRFGELMSSWAHLSDVAHLSTSESEDWSVGVEYRATDQVLAMSDWVHLSDIAHIQEGTDAGFTDWRLIPTSGDATGRVFQFRVRMESITPNVTPRLFDATIKADMPDREDVINNLVSSASVPTVVTYVTPFKGPGTTPVVQIAINDAQSGDYWQFVLGSKTLDGFQIVFYDKTNTQVVRNFDVGAKGYGSRNATTI